jgi:hypothetical protein
LSSAFVACGKSTAHHATLERGRGGGGASGAGGGKAGGGGSRLGFVRHFEFFIFLQLVVNLVVVNFADGQHLAPAVTPYDAATIGGSCAMS